VSESVHKEFHPREVELARELHEQEDWVWNIQTGDWFYGGGTHHVVLRTEELSGKTYLYTPNENSFELSDVVPLRHRVDCREWLMENGWDLDAENLAEGAVRVSAHRRQTDFKVERTEPTELAAIYSVMLEVNNMIHFGWA